MKRFFLFLLLLSAIVGASTWTEDPFLGAPFRIFSYRAGNQNSFQATLVRYADSSVCREIQKPRAAILYVQGFNDYFFQRELAQKMNAAGYAFYAVDLHHYGRSYREGEVMGELRDISEYYAELDSALSIIRREEGTSIPLVLLGHSTGGLISSLYASDRNNGADFAAIVLNSPFLAMNFSWAARRIALPILSALGGVFPNLGVPQSESDCYDRSIHQLKGGEWNYDTTYKKLGELPVDLGWVRAIHQGHVRLQQGLRLEPPVLVMHSGCSYDKAEWSEECNHCDAVLNVTHIRKYGANLGHSVELEEIEGGLHDLYLSPAPVRQKAYDVTIEFLNSKIKSSVE